MHVPWVGKLLYMHMILLCHTQSSLCARMLGYVHVAHNVCIAVCEAAVWIALMCCVARCLALVQSVWQLKSGQGFSEPASTHEKHGRRGGAWSAYGVGGALCLRVCGETCSPGPRIASKVRQREALLRVVGCVQGNAWGFACSHACCR